MTQLVFSKFKNTFQSIFFTMVIGLLPFGADIQAQLTVTVETTNISCQGFNNGSATLTITGGCTPYSIEWLDASGNILGTGISQGGLLPGSTTVQIEDNCGEMTFEQVVIEEPDNLIAILTNQSPVTCFGACDGFVELSIIGGTPPYTATFPSGATVSADGLSGSGLCSGVLVIPVLDANGCSSSAITLIEEPEELQFSSTTTDATCNGNDGQARIAVTGGIPPYTYSWLDASGTEIAIGATAQGLSPGTYNVQIEDFYSCFVTSLVILEQSTACNGVNFEGRIALEGFKAGAEMSTMLSNSSLVPSTQPFTAAPFLYNGTESVSVFPANTVDWILVELRDVNQPTLIVDQKAGLLDKFGDIRSTDGSLGLKFDSASSGQYFVVVHHRGHLSVMSSEEISLPNTGLTYDFSASAFSVKGVDQLKFSNGFYLMKAGDYDNNGTINFLDFLSWFSKNNFLNAYLPDDADGNGTVNFLDFLLWFSNNNQLGHPEI